VGTLLPRGESLIVFANKKNNSLSQLARELHAAFRISSNIDGFYLVRPNRTTIVDSHIDFEPTRTNASAGWGLDQNAGFIPKKQDSGHLRFFLEGTPGDTNSFESCTGFSLPPTVSPNGQILTNITEEVTFGTTQDGSVVHDTLDGSNPTSAFYDSEEGAILSP